MTEKKIVVVAIGGNSLIKDKEHQTVKDQYDAAGETTRHIADMIEDGWDVAGMHELSLDVCGADSQGAIGYALQQNLQNELYRRGIHKPVATIITQVLVDKSDPAFENPSKPIGSFMEKDEAKQRASDMGWNVVEDAGRGWRRVVASPLPKKVVEIEAVKTLIEAGVIVVTVGGGGIHVIEKSEGEYTGTAAVIDKDFASALLANRIGAQIALNFGKPNQEWVDQMTLAEAKNYLAEGIHFLKGSMAPKIQAIIWFLEVGGKQAIVTNPENIGRALKGETGTRIVLE